MTSSFIQSASLQVSVLRCALGFMVVMSLPLSAQQQAAQEQAIEEVVVKGIRGSLQKSLATKRTASNIVDAISAEEIGKFPDQNVAESLQRISGIQISRNKGEGESVSIRGLDPDLSLVMINGRRAPSSTANSATYSTEQRGRRFQFDQLSAELVSSLEVYKTAQARLEEGGVAGTINIRTPRPLDIGQRASLRVGSSYNALAEEFGPELGGLFSNVFNENFGVMLAVSYSDKTLRQDFTDQPGFNFIDIDQDLNILNADQTDLASSELLYNDVFYPQSSRLFAFSEKRKRLGVSGTAQLRVTDDLVFTADAFYTSLDVVENSDYIEALGRTVTTFNSVQANANGTVVSYSANGGFRTVAQTRDPEVETLIVGLNAEYLADRWKLQADVSMSQNESQETRNLLLYTRDDSPFTISFLDGKPFSLVPGFDVTDPAAFGAAGLGLFRRNPLSGKDEDLSVKLDAERLFEGGTLTTIQFGVKLTASEKDVDDDLVNVLFNSAGDMQIPLQDVARVGGLGVDNLLASSGANLPDGFAVPDIQTWLNVPGAADEVIPGENPLADFVVQEDILAAYIQADFEGENFTADVGVRLVQTDQTSSGFANVTLDLTGGDSGGSGLSGDGFTPVAEDNDYFDVLPAANFAYNLSEDVKLRLAAAKVMSRPDLALISPALSINLSQSVATAGEPGLDPYRATQYDAAIEWYMSDTSLLSAGVFYKDIDSFIDFVTRSEEIFGTTLDVTRPVNGQGVALNGFEFNYQQTYDFLPSPFDGFGIIFNYTHIANDAELINELTGQAFGLPGSSENSYNLVAIYEKYDVGVRLAYNYRDEFVETVSGNRGNPQYVDAYGQLDLSVNYDISDTMSIALDAINLTDEVVEKYAFIPERSFEYAETGRRFMVSLRASF